MKPKPLPRKTYTIEQVARVLKRRGAMDVCTQPGMQVIFASPNSGYDGEKKRVAELGLLVGRVYTVETISVGRSSSRITLKEFGREHFNTVFFCNLPRAVVPPNDTYFECKYFGALRAAGKGGGR